MAKISDILDVAKSIDFMFDEVTRKARQEKLVAKFRGNMARHASIDKAWREARDAKEEALAALEETMLSTDIADSIIGELNAQKDAARKLLDKLRKAEDVLETFQKVAALGIKVAKRVTAISGI